MEMVGEERRVSSSEWTVWPINWTAVWVGALTALAVALIIGLIGLAVGAHQVSRITRWHDVRLVAGIFAICGAFFSMVAGGWVAGRIAGIRRAENAMLQGGVVWVLAVPLLLVAAALGAGGYMGWFAGLAGTPAWSATAPSPNPDLAAIQRNMALASVVSLLLGLVGGVLGGWLSSGESMSLTAYRRRSIDRAETKRIAA
jgi:hypothetical protein